MKGEHCELMVMQSHYVYVCIVANHRTHSFHDLKVVSFIHHHCLLPVLFRLWQLCEMESEMTQENNPALRFLAAVCLIL